MDKDTYYVFAIILASASSLISAISLFLVLRDRSFRTRCIPAFVSRIGSSDVFLDPRMAADPTTQAQGRAAILICNDSMSLCTLEAITLRPMVKPLMKVFFQLGESIPIEGQFAPANFPQTIKGREVSVFTFNPSHIGTNKFGEINIKFVGGRCLKLDIATSFYRISKLRRLILRSRAAYR